MPPGISRQIGQPVQVHQVFLQPLAIGLAGRYFSLDFIIRNNSPFIDIHQKHPSGLQATLSAHILRLDLEHAGFRSHNHDVVFGHRVARGPQAVAVQYGPDAGAVAEGNGCRSVPGFDKAGMIFIERFFLIVHGLVLLPGLRDQHHDGMGQGSAGVV